MVREVLRLSQVCRSSEEILTRRRRERRDDLQRLVVIVRRSSVRNSVLLALSLSPRDSAIQHIPAGSRKLVLAIFCFTPMVFRRSGHNLAKIGKRCAAVRCGNRVVRAQRRSVSGSVTG